MADGHGNPAVPQGGDVRDTRYSPLASPLRFSRLDRGVVTDSRQGSPTRGRYAA